MPADFPYREIIELRSMGLSLEKVAYLTGTIPLAVSEALKRAADLGIAWPVPVELSDRDLRQLLGARRAPTRHPADCESIFQGVREQGIATRPSKRHLNAAWEAYLASAAGSDLAPYGRQGFEAAYRAWLRERNDRPWMMVNWTPAEEVQVDWAGATVPIYGKDGTVTPAYLFVATMPYSDYTFARASLDMAMQSWLEHHRALFEFLGGAPMFLTPDNLACAVTLERQKEGSGTGGPKRTVNRRYQDLADHYGTIVVPARVRSPKDKAAVEQHVHHVARRLSGIIGQMRFSSADQLNAALEDLVTALNDRPMAGVGWGRSRREIFLQDEAPHMAPLPERPFESVTWAKAKADKDAVITVRGVHYGLPESCAKALVRVRISDDHVEAFTEDDAQLLARHARREDGSDTFEGFAGRRPDRYKPLAEWAAQNGREAMLAQWHPEKNGGLDLQALRCRSKKPVWWLCPDCGYEWRKSPRARVGSLRDDCPACSNTALTPGRNDLATLRPDLAAEWHPERNGCAPADVAPSFSMAVWWKGSACGHEWLASPAQRTTSAVGALCPYCSGQRALLGFNDVATLAPEMAKLWHRRKNRCRRPESTPASSKRGVYLSHGPFSDETLESPHAWLARNGLSHLLEPFDRMLEEAWAADKRRRRQAPAGQREGKPSMRGGRTIRGQGIAISLGEWCRRFHRGDLAAQWHPERNGEVTMEDVGPCDQRKAWWLCPDCGYEWQAPVATRTARAAECPAHTPGKRVIPGVNDLAVRGASFVKYYSAENELPPERVSDRHQLPLLWKCPDCGHGWLMKLDTFPGDHASCPKCSRWKPDKGSGRRQVAYGTTDLMTKAPAAAALWHPTKNGVLSPKHVPYRSKKEAWWLCPECGKAWHEPVDSMASRKPSRCPKCADRAKAEKREAARRETEEKQKRAEERAAKKAAAKEADRGRAAERESAREKRALEAAARKLPERESPREGKSGKGILSVVRPDLAAEWHPTKNGDITPDMVTAGSGMRAWWKCSACQHEWPTTVCRRNQKTNCPMCARKKSGRRLKPGENDLATACPHLAEQFHPTKNGSLGPGDVLPKSGIPIWWLCPECGGEWRASPISRSRAKWQCCPKCARKKRFRQQPAE